MWGVVPLVGDKESSKIGFGEPIREVFQLEHGPLMVGMAACHSLTRIDEDLIGDPLDLKVSEETKALVVSRSVLPFCFKSLKWH